MFSQLDFGSDAVKPTRLLLQLAEPLHEAMLEGPPAFNEDGFYVGPLPKREGSTFTGRHQGVFRTAAAAAWPAGLCKWAAEAIIAAYMSRQYRVPADGTSNGEGGQKRRHEDNFAEEEEDEKGLKRRRTLEDCDSPVDPMDPPFKGGEGPRGAALGRVIRPPSMTEVGYHLQAGGKGQSDPFPWGKIGGRSGGSWRRRLYPMRVVLLKWRRNFCG